MQVVPQAVGQTDGVVVFWDDHAEIGVVLPRPTQLTSELQWGIGTLNEEPCLILYLYAAEQAIEMYLQRMLPTSPEEELDVWQLLLQWKPEIIKLRYGTTPVQRDKEVALLLPTGAGADLISQLRGFVKQTEKQFDGTADTEQYRSLVDEVKTMLEEHDEEQKQEESAE